jgi:hypothetical protein
MPAVRTALHAAWPLCYPGDDDAVDIGRGGCAKRIMVDDSRLYPDWAGVRKSQMTSLGYKNLCPGESKLATKWSTSKEGQMEDDFFLPLSQLQTYCGRQWNARHGYIITPDELVVVQVSRELVGPGLAASRPVRNVPQYARDKPSHTRDFSIETISSGVDAMSIDKGSSYHDDENPDIEYGTLLYKSIPWDAAGTGTLTAMLALWWIHKETKTNVSVQNRYTPLNTRKVKVGTGISKHEPAARVNDSQCEPSKRQQTTPDSPLNTRSTSTDKKGKDFGKKKDVERSPRECGRLSSSNFQFLTLCTVLS